MHAVLVTTNHIMEASKIFKHSIITCTLLVFQSPHQSNAVISDQVADNLIPENYTTVRVETSAPTLLEFYTFPYVVPIISAKLMEFGIDIRLNILWYDTRLRLNVGNGGIIPKHIAARLWYPWIEFQNCKGCEQSMIDYNKNNYVLFRGGIIVVIRKSLSFSCDFDLHHYPFDLQTCHVDIRLSKWNGPITLNLTADLENYNKVYKHTLITPAEFKLLNINIVFRKNDKNEILFTYTFHFKRIYISHVLLLYLPSILIVVLSWISFWLDVSAAAPRVALGLTSLLTLATQFNSAQKDLPAMATVKALDIWMFSCMFMVFGSLIEFAVAYRQYQLKSKEISNVMAYRRKPKQLKEMSRFCRQMKRAICKRNGNGKTIDDISKMLFPICFLTFNVTYWSYFVG